MSLLNPRPEIETRTCQSEGRGKKIVLIRDWARHPSTFNFTRTLGHQFPGHEFEIVDIPKLLKRHPATLAVHSAFVLKDYGRTMWHRHGAVLDYFYATPFLFRRIKTLMARRLGCPSQYSFTFQLHSLFDASVPGVPHFVYTDHTLLANLSYPDFDRGWLFQPEWIELERTIYENAVRVFTRSSNISRSVVQDYGVDPGKVECVYAGVNAAPSDTLPQNDGYRNQEILFVGSDWERKGGPELVAAFKRVQRTYPKAHLTVVGCSPSLDGVNGTVAGRVPLDRLHEYYGRASIFCVPTRVEPFGIAFIEAMAHRLPVIATCLGAIPDFVQDGINGYLVPPGDVDALAGRLCDALAAPERCKAWGEQGYRIMQERYNWDQVGNRIRTTIHELGVV